VIGDNKLGIQMLNDVKNLIEKMVICFLWENMHICSKRPSVTFTQYVLEPFRYLNYSESNKFGT